MQGNHRPRASNRIPRRAEWFVPLGLLLLVAALAGGANAAMTVPSVTVEDGSSVVLSNDTITIDGSLGGAHPGQVIVANNSRLTLFNISLTFVNTTNEGGLWVGSAGGLEVIASQLTASSASRFSISVTGGARLWVNGSNFTSLQIPGDITAAAIVLDSGAALFGADSSFRVRPDVRPLAEITDAALDLDHCDITGSVKVLRGTAVLHLVHLRTISDGFAVDVEGPGASVVITNSTVVATGGGSAVSSSRAGGITVRSSNLSAEDIGVFAVGGSMVTLSDVVLDAGGDLSGSIGAFGLVTDASALTADNIAVFGFPTSLWVRSSDVTLTAALLGSGLVRVNASSARLVNSSGLYSGAIVEAGSVLTLTDTAIAWPRVDVSGGSVIIPQYRATYEFHDQNGTLDPGVAWTVFPKAGLPLGSGVSGANGLSLGPALDGPHFNGVRFDQAPVYRIDYSKGNASFSSTITAWGSGLTYPFYLLSSLNDLSFGDSLFLSDARPAAGSTFDASAVLSVSRGASNLDPIVEADVLVRVLVDSIEVNQSTRHVTESAPSNFSFQLLAQPGVHFVQLRADFVSGGRGNTLEPNELANNWLSIWYNSSTSNVTSVKPDLAVANLWLEFTNSTARDPVTGETRSARALVVFVNVSNIGLTGAGVFDVAILANAEHSNVRVFGIAAGTDTVVNVTFGPYIDSQDLVVIAIVDVNSSVNEGNESNNRWRAETYLVVPPPKPAERPLWLSFAVLGAAVGLIALSLWGTLRVLRREPILEPGDEPGTPGGPPGDAPSTTDPEEIGSSAGAGPASLPIPPPPPPPRMEPVPAPPALPATPPPPTAGGAPAHYPWGSPTYPPPPYPGYYPQPYGAQPPAQRYTQPPAAPPTPPLAPPATCPKCNSPKVSYLLVPTRSVVCANCGTSTPF